VSSGKGSFHRSASVAPQIWVAQGNSQQTYQQLLRRGVPKAELDWWLQQGPLSWDYPFPEPNNLKVGIDWHNTLQMGEGNSVPTYNEYALELLLEKGFKVTILSYCGEERSTQCLQPAWKLKCNNKLARIEWCRVKTGVLGKAWLYKACGITTVFDDRQEICEESLAKGLEAFPICNFREYHYWFRQQTGRQPYRTFAVAVQDFLRLRNIRV
jgi:hypothetical protein